ncbi:sigma 54-interacting transcriptional regulator [Desulfococcaceae bacterium HSG8]|nr:sigma 54-interacting transcriptional regulator [Desulfococcaceae bacterium HSG8]
MPLGMDEPRKSDARIVAATNQNLSSLQNEGKFRKDLNYRLRTHRIYIPPLCDRMDDVPLLTEHFLEEAARSLKKKKPTPPKELFTLLRAYSFPGNIRELQSMIFDAVSRHKGGILSLDVFKFHINREQANAPESLPTEQTAGSPPPLVSFPGRKLPTIKQATEVLVDEAMKRADGNQSIAAKMLGISQQAMSKRMKKKG